MSKIEVNTIEPQCGTTVTVGKCTSTVAVPGNVIKSNAVQASDGGNIVSQSGTDITLGASGDTVALACGASQTGFGRSGTVDWDTSIKTGTVTAVSGSGYFVNTTSGGITVNLPAAAVGSIVAVSDYASTADSNNITVAPNGSDKINGVNDNFTISTAGLAVTLVYADATRGWKSVTGSDEDATGVVGVYVAASGGNQPTATGCIVDTNYKFHKFTGPGTFTVTCAGNGAGSNTIDYLVVAGGGSGASRYGGAGGAGGYRESPGAASGCYTVSPLGVAPAAALPVTATGYPVTVGGGGAGVSCSGTNPGTAGANSVFAGTTTITSAGGGHGGGQDPGTAGTGGSGGGSSYTPPGAAGNTPPVTPAQGTGGGDGSGGGPKYAAGGGGGALVAGTTGDAPTSQSGPGGGGATSSIDGTPTARAGGGGGGANSDGPTTAGTGGTGGGGAGGTGPGSTSTVGTINTGGGSGGGFGFPGLSGNGGSGIVIIRYKFQ